MKTRLRVLGPSGGTVPCLLFLADGDGRPVRPPGHPFWHDHIAFSGDGVLDLPDSPCVATVERGPEWRPARADLRGGEQTVRLERLADLAASGWRSGDLHIHRPPEDLPLLADAADLHVAPGITWWNAGNPWANLPIPKRTVTRTPSGRHIGILGGEDEREGGALLFHGLAEPLPIQDAARDHPSSAVFLEAAKRRRGAWVEIEKPFWWDVPLWLSSGRIDSVEIAHNHLHRGGVLDNEAWGRPRDRKLYPGPHGVGVWTQELYSRILEAGFRIPPTGGSASGVLPNPVGYNRVYVRTGRDTGHAAWWRALRGGRCFVTNGPLLDVRASGRDPGAVFHAPPGGRVTVEVVARAWGHEPLAWLEVVRDGQVAEQVDARGSRDQTHRFTLHFDAPGWFLVRAVADVADTFRFASTAPFTVEVPGMAPRISRAAVAFFASWLEERWERVGAPEREEARPYFEAARRFWRARLDRASVA